MIEIGKLQPADREAWETLFRGYIDFYERTLPQEMYDRAWALFRQDERMHALGAKAGGRQIGRASCRDSVCMYASSSVFAVSLIKNRSLYAHVTHAYETQT